MVGNESMKERAHSVLENLVFRLRDVELVKGDSDWRRGQQVVDSYALLVVTNGKGVLTMEGEEVRLFSETAYVCRPGQTYGLAAQTSEGMEVYFFRFDVLREMKNDGRISCVEEPRFLSGRGKIPLYPVDKLALLCDTIYRCRQSGDELEHFRSQFCFQELLYHVLKNSRLLSGDSQTALECAREYMERYYDENLTIEQLARIAEVSPKYFVDLFKKTYGISAMDYLTELRINRAKQLMARSDARLRDIAQQVGYNDEFYFSRKFKKEVGMAPTIYMKSRRRKIAAYRSANIGQLLALKMIPHAAPLHPKWTAYYYNMYRSDIPVHLSAYRGNQHWESNIETLAHVRPDVVISMDNVEDVEKEKLEKAAPVFYVPWEKDWREQLRLTADFLGESAEARHWLERYERHVKSARDRIKCKWRDDTFLVVRILKQSLYAINNRSMADVLFNDLQLVPAYQDGRSVYNEEISLQQLADMDADHLFVMVRREAETLAYWKTLQHSMMWQELKAVRNHRTYCIPSDPWLEYSASAHRRVVDEVLTLLSGNGAK